MLKQLVYDLCSSARLTDVPDKSDDSFIVFTLQKDVRFINKTSCKIAKRMR